MKEKLEKGPKPVKDKEVNVGPWWVTERRKPSTINHSFKLNFIKIKIFNFYYLSMVSSKGRVKSNIQLFCK